MMTSGRDYLTDKQVAAILEISLRTFYRQRKEGDCPAWSIHRGRPRTSLNAMEDYLRSLYPDKEIKRLLDVHEGVCASNVYVLGDGLKALTRQMKDYPESSSKWLKLIEEHTQALDQVNTLHAIIKNSQTAIEHSPTRAADLAEMRQILGSFQNPVWLPIWLEVGGISRVEKLVSFSGYAVRM